MEQDEAALVTVKPKKEVIVGGLSRGIDEVASNVTYVTHHVSFIETGAIDEPRKKIMTTNRVVGARPRYQGRLSMPEYEAISSASDSKRRELATIW